MYASTSIEGEGGDNSQVNICQVEVLRREKHGREAREKENYWGGSLLDNMMREGLLMIFEWRAEGCEGLSPEISRFRASERITYKNIKAVKWERP